METRIHKPKYSSQVFISLAVSMNTKTFVFSALKHYLFFYFRFLPLTEKAFNYSYLSHQPKTSGKLFLARSFFHDRGVTTKKQRVESFSLPPNAASFLLCLVLPQSFFPRKCPTFDGKTGQANDDLETFLNVPDEVQKNWPSSGQYEH